MGTLKVPKKMFCGFIVFWTVVRHKTSQFTDSKGDIGSCAIGEIHALANKSAIR